MTKLNPQDLVELLGRYHDDPVVEDVLSHYSVRNRPVVKVDLRDPDGPVVDTQSYVKNSHNGIEFGFDDEAAWLGLDETQFGRRPMVLTQIYLYGEHEGVRPYREQLPFGLQLFDDRSVVRRKLNSLETTRHSHIRDTWDAPKFRLTVAYTDAGQAIDFILCMLREPPLPPLMYDLVEPPTLDRIVECLGLSVDAPVLQGCFGAIGLEDRIAEIEETREADLAVPYGLILSFSPPLDTVDSQSRTLVLSSVTFLQERELGARGWMGELPYGLSFDDSPETAARKIGRSPDREQEDWFSGTAAWYGGDFTLLLLYNTMENRIARVGVFAPGY